MLGVSGLRIGRMLQGEVDETYRNGWRLAHHTGYDVRALKTQPLPLGNSIFLVKVDKSQLQGHPSGWEIK